MTDLGWTRRVVAAAWLVVALGCGGGSKPADSADDAAGETQSADWTGSLGPGTEVCVSGTSGVRYVIDDLLTERGLENSGDCMVADVEFEELGDAGAWELKYRATGEPWQSCKSTEQER
ncbi:MAG: hypothetical protein JRI68_34485, partial [Deltaproteobacteria bacterium]|nr:hypothetical protein [Deltaproteobacteria bacterium]